MFDMQNGLMFKIHSQRHPEDEGFRAAKETFTENSLAHTYFDCDCTGVLYIDENVLRTWTKRLGLDAGTVVLS
jgi:hypothetical protein